jgi:hypothetical protein
MKGRKLKKFDLHGDYPYPNYKFDRSKLNDDYIGFNCYSSFFGPGPIPRKLYVFLRKYSEVKPYKDCDSLLTKLSENPEARKTICRWLMMPRTQKRTEVGRLTKKLLNRYIYSARQSIEIEHLDNEIKRLNINIDDD